MNENYKELYSYLKNNGLTDLDENSFFNEYSSNQSKFDELYSYLKNEGMTDLSSDDFKNKYLPSISQPKKKEDGGLLQEAQRTIQQYSQSLSPSQESDSQQLSPSVSSLVEPYKEQKVKKLSPIGTTIPAIDYTTMQEDLSWQDKTGVSQSSINQNKIESEEKAKELAILEEKRRKKEAADDITRAREMFARRAEEEKIRLENEKLNLDYRTKDLNFLSNLNSVTSDLISTTKENVVQKLNEKFKGNGIVFEEAGWGTNRIIARTEDGKSVINIGSYNFLDSANTSEAEKLRNFISKNAKRIEDIGDRDFLSNSLKAQNLRAVPMIENGEPSTVRFTSFEEDGKFLVIPTLFPKDPNKYTTNPSTWMELPFEQARKVAMERGEVFTFKTQKEADDFAKGSWKDVNTIDIEGDSFFKALGKDYMTEKKRYERFTELDDIIDFAEKVYKYEGTSMTEQELQKKYPKYFISGKARFDLEKMLPEMKKERDALKPLVKDYTFFNQEGTSEDARMMWDKYLQDRNNQISSQAAAVNRDAKIQEMNLDKKSYEKFGVSIKDLKNYAVTNPSQKKEYDQLINQYVDAQDKKVIASEYMQEAKLYFDAKDNKNIMQEFSENFSGVVNSTLDAYRENEGGAALLNFAIGLKNASKIKDVKEAAEYIKNLRGSMSGTQSKELTRFQNVSDFSELIDVISDDPISVITSLVGSSFAAQLPVGSRIIPATVSATTAYGAATGGLTTGGVGFVPGAIGGFFSGLSTGQAITEFVTEYNTALIDAIKKRGYDMEDPYSLQKALLNKEVWDEALEIGVTRGVPMAIMEKVTGGLSGRVFVPSSRLATTASKLKGYALESAVIDPTSETLGELAAQGAMVATGKQDKIQYTELYGEFLGGLGSKSMTNGANTLYKIVRDHNNINLAYDLTDVANVAKENVSDERIVSWADNMVRLGKIDNNVAQRIRENVGLKREAKELMSVGEKPSSDVVARTMELMAAKQELTKTKNRSEVYKEKISEIDEELANMASTKKVADKDSQTSLVGITEAVRPSVAEYTINNRRYSKERFLDKINSMSPSRISRNDVKVLGDEEVINLLNKKTNAIQKQTTSEVPVQPEARVSETMVEGKPTTGLEVTTQETITQEKPKEEVTPTQSTVDIFSSAPTDTKAEIKFMSPDGTEVSLDGNEEVAAQLYDDAVSMPSQERTEEQVTLIEKLQPIVDKSKTEAIPTTEVTPATEVKVEFTDQDKARKRELEDGLKYSDKRRKTLTIGGVTMTRAEANTELEALKQKETKSIESEVASIEKLFSEKKDTKDRQKVLEQVNRAVKAVQSIIPKIKVIVHDTNEDYENATGDTDQASGIFIPSKDGGTIHINLSRSNTRTVAHEVFHAVLLNGIKTDAEAKRLTDAMIKAVRKSLEQSADKKTLDEFNQFVSQYDQNIQNEEYLAEVFGYLAENFKQLPKPAQSVISRFLEKIAKLFGIKPMTDSEVIDFMNTISRKVATGEEVTESDINAFTQMKEGLESQGGSGFVGTFSIPRRKIDYEIIQATSAKDDSRDWVKNLVQDVDIREFDGQSFITNMYDYTNAGVTDLGNGITLNLFGGKNYVPYMMSLRGLKIGDLSNLAAFNTKANAEGFIRNARESGATLFSPHAGTKNQSWQFQHAIFEELVKAVLNNNVLTGKELIQIFNQGLINKKGNYIPPFAQFRKKYGNISDFSEFENNPLGLVELLNIENNYSPNLRKRLVDLLVADKKFQKKIGIKNKGQFYERIEDPLNKGVVGGELMGIVKFDPNTFKVRKTKPGDIDHHPSFGWTLEANIEGIYQPTEFYKSYDVTDSYTKYNKKEVVVSKKGESTVKNFIKSNVSSSAGALPKVATFENLSPRQQKLKKEIDEIEQLPAVKKKQESNDIKIDQGLKSRQQKVKSEKSSGTTQVATTIGSYISAANIIKDITGNVLDYGAGLGLGTDAMSETLGRDVDSYEPNPERWKGKKEATYTSSDQINKKYDAIVSLNVLNVVPKDIRDAIINDIFEKLNVNGKAVISTRGWVGDVNAAKNAVPGPEEKSLIITRKQDGQDVKVFQKGFDGNELVNYIKSLLGDNVDVVKKAGFGKSGVIITKKSELSDRQQKAKNELQEIIKQARDNGNSEAGIRAYFKKNGLSDIEIDELLEKEKGAGQKIELSDETLPGYTKLMNRIKDIIARGKKAGKSDDDIMKGVIANVESRSTEYANATDQQREQIIRDIRKMFGKKEKSAPSAKKILGINFSNKLTIEERVLRDLQIKSEIKGAKNAVAKMKLMKQYINSVVRDWSKGVKGKVSLSQMKNIISKLNSTNLFDDGSINKFLDYMFNVINDAEYKNKLEKAQSNLSRIKSAIKNLKDKKSPILKELAKQFSKLDSSITDDIDLFNSIAENILSNLSLTKVAETINYDELSLWISESRFKEDEIKKARLAEIIKEITGTDADGLSYDQMVEILESLKEKSTEKDETEIRENLQEAFDNAKLAYQFDEKNPIVDRFVQIDLNKLDLKDAIEVVFALANYIENKDTAKMETIISKYEGQMNASIVEGKKMYTSKFKAFSRFMNEQFANLPLLFEKIFNGVKKSIYVMEMMGVNSLMQSYSTAKNIFNGIVSEYVSAFYEMTPNNQAFNTLYNNIERGMLASVMRSPVGNLNDVKKDFERNRGLILDAIEKLSAGDQNQVKIAAIYQMIYDKILKDSNNVDDVMSKVDPVNVQAVNWWIDKWADVYDEMYDVSLNVYNKQLDKDINYTSSKFSFININEDIIEDEDTSYDYATGTSKMYEKMAGNLKKAIKPTQRNLSKGLYLDLNFDTVNANAMNSVLVDIKTAASIKKIKGFIESKSFAKIFPSDIRSVVVKRVNEYIKNIRKKRPYDSDEFAKIMNILEGIAKYATSQALGGVTQPLKQVFPGLLNTIIQTKDLSSLTKIFDKNVHKFLNESGYGISNRGVESATQMENINKMIEIAAESNLSKALKIVGDINDKFIKMLLVSPDIFAARAAWISYYEQYMRKNYNIKNIDYSSHKIDKDAAAYAETMVSRQMNVNESELAGSFFNSNDTGKKWIRNTLLPFANFRINQYLRTSSDVSRLVRWKLLSKEDRMIALSSLSGTMAEMFLYKALAASIGVGLSALAMSVRGDEGDEEDWERIYSNSIKGSATSAVTDFISPLPLTDQFVRGGVGLFIDQIQSLNDVPEEERWNIFTKDEIDVLDTYGKIGIPLKRAFDIKDGFELVVTGKFTDKYGNEKYISDSDREILQYGIIGGAFVNIFGLGIGPEYSNTYNKILKQAKKDAKTENQINKEIQLSGYENKSDLKRYNPEEYERLYGEGGVYYEEIEQKKAANKEKREEDRKSKDIQYGYEDKPKSKKSTNVMSGGVMNKKSGAMSDKRLK